MFFQRKHDPSKSQNTIDIKKLTPADTQTYRSLRLLSLQTDPLAFFFTYDELSGVPLTFFQTEIHSAFDSVFGYYGVWLQGQMIGYGALIRPTFIKQSHIAELQNLYIHPSHRRTGLARSLAKKLIRVAQTSHLESLFLTVVATNSSAIALYKALGFVPYATKEKSLLTSDGVYLDELLMKLDLSDS